MLTKQKQTTQKTNMSPAVIDLLATTPRSIPFAVRVQELILSPKLEQKVLQQAGRLPDNRSSLPKGSIQLTIDDEKELATEMLLLRHRFTEIVSESKQFRQAALTIIQNIYLFQNRKIFFGTSSATSSEQERQEALQLFSTHPSRTSIPLARTFQHLILARVWNRILCTSTETDLQQEQFTDLHAVVEKLNTIRNIYIVLTTGLVKKLVARINEIYKESVTQEDASQIGSFGIARAAYRYHHSIGIRFSTYAANWVFKEIQRQSLEGRLIRLSTNTVEQYARATKDLNEENVYKFLTQIENATPAGEDILEENSSISSPSDNQSLSLPTRDYETKELHTTLLCTIDQLLSEKSADILKRRFGFPPYQGQEQSTISISKLYGVTRGSIYQLEQAALKRLNQHLQAELR